MSRKWEIILCSGAEHLANQFKKLGYNIHTSRLNYDGKRFFPNSDLYTRLDSLEELEGKQVLVVQSATYSGELDKEKFTTADRFWETLQVLDILKNPIKVFEKAHKEYEYQELKPPKEVVVLYTFLPCALQDKAFKTGEAMSAKLAVELTLMKADKVATIDPHPPEKIPWVKKLVDNGKLELLSAVPTLVEEAAKRFNLDSYDLITPDEGAQERFGIKGFKKRRFDSFTVIISGDSNVKGKKVIIVDDLTKSGSTLIKARNFLMENGAKEVISCVTHVLPTMSEGEKLLRNLVKKLEGKILTTNTVRTKTFEEENPKCLVDIVPIIHNWLQTT
ncbi:MAG: phosphoribosyltransferase family protein [Candidatus Baldrarchaeota archaeon]